jgi:plastin-1
MAREKLKIFVAKLAISIARKMNALIFLVPEDIVDVRPRLVSRRFEMHWWL